MEIPYLKSLVESMMGESIDINSLASNMDFKATTKLPLKYAYTPKDDLESMPPLSYTQSRRVQRIATVTADGKETENTANVDDFIFSGPSGEKYVLTPAKLSKNYTGTPGQTLTPEQGPRFVARYDGTEIVSFVAPWGEQMVLKPGDFVVKADDGYYRIAAKEFMHTYNMP